jgi:integrase
MAEKLTDKLLKALTPPATGNKITYDTEIRGFGARITAASAISFVMNYRANGRERRLTIGSFPDWSVGAAREEAKNLKRRIDVGDDPMGQRHEERAAPTVNDLCTRFETEHLAKRRPATIRDYGSLIKLYIKPKLGTMRVADVRHSDVERLHHTIAAGAPYQANRTIAVLSKMFALAVKWELRETNPVPGIERAREEKRERYLTPAEIARLGDALAAHHEKASANAVRLLLLTGARRSEVLSAKWEMFDLTAGVWTKPAATTKQAKLHRVPLSPPALEVLTEMRAAADLEASREAKFPIKVEGGPSLYLFPGVEGKPLQDIKHFWAAIIKAAELPGVRLHDLRHTYASILASSGLSLPIIGALLGHTQAATTHRYSHLLDDPLRAATERAGAVIAGAGKPSAEVVPLVRKA